MAGPFLASVAALLLGVGSAVVDEHAAISAAHREWQARNPQLHVASERVWQKEFSAEHRGNEWAVWPNVKGNMATFYIDARNGHLIRVEMID